MDGEERSWTYSEKLACPEHGASLPELAPRIFSFNAPQGACPACDGLGHETFFDAHLVIPDERSEIGDETIPLRCLNPVSLLNRVPAHYRSNACPMIRLFVRGDLAPDTAVAPTLDQSRYLTNVMRLSQGDALLIFNGQIGRAHV